MIPKTIHQTWRDHDIPEPRRWPESWKRLNPDWTYRLWTDAELAALVRDHYPEFEAIFHSYPRPVQRADLGRYLILHHAGGIYADLDAECLQPLDAIVDEVRVVLAEEPMEHAISRAPLGLHRMIFNGVMASPRGHPFWTHVLATLKRCRHSAFVLESTGPLMLTGAVDSYGDPEGLAISSCQLFNASTYKIQESLSPVAGPYGHLRLADHYWVGRWWQERAPHWTTSIKRRWRRARARLAAGPSTPSAEVRSRCDASVLREPVRSGDVNVSVLVPVRDAAPFLDRMMALLLRLDYPRAQLSVTFCEGDSRDDSRARLQALIDTHGHRFRRMTVTTCAVGGVLDRDRRWLPGLQRERRAKLARVRNHLVETGCLDDDHWTLWIDADVCDYDPGILRRLLSEGRKVVTPDCVTEDDGPSYDLNAYNDWPERKDHRYYKHVRDGLFMPPADHDRRMHLHDFRFLDRVPLTSVGGTMLLVHASVFRAGLRFPEVPYDDLIETEGFGRLCRDLGVQPYGLPQIAIRHVAT